MRVDSIVNQIFQSVTYILSASESQDVWLVDCGDVDRLDQSLHVVGVLLTHTHFDHIYGLNDLVKRNSDVKVFTNAYGKAALQNPRLNLSHYHPEMSDFVMDRPENVVEIGDGSVIDVLGCEVRVKSVPGHDGSCLAFILEDKLFTGDAYMPGKRVVTNLPRCDKGLALSSEQILKTLSGEYQVMPGHAE